MAVAVVDIGKTNAKVSVFDARGQHLAAVSRANDVVTAGLYRHEDTEALWAFILDALAGFAKHHTITAIVPTAHGASGVLVDADGLVLPFMDYEDPILDTVEDEYTALRPPFSETFSPPLAHGLNFGRQVYYQKTRHLDAFSRATALLMHPQFWAWRLSGVMASEVTSLACHTDLWAPDAGAPSSLARKLGLEPLLPPLRRAMDTLGPITPAVAARTGLAPTTRVVCGIHDSNASLLPFLATREPPFTVVSTGTWVVLLHVGGSTARLDPAADMLANVDALGRPVPCARFMGGREFALIAPDDAPPDLALVLELLSAPVLALPTFTDHGGPYAGRFGRIAGEVPQVSGARATLASLYAALMTDDLLTRLDAKGPVIVDGQFGRNAVYAAALARLREGQTVFAAGEGAGTSAGAALLADWPPDPATVALDLTTVAPLAHDLSPYRSRWRAAL